MYGKPHQCNADLSNLAEGDAMDATNTYSIGLPQSDAFKDSAGVSISGTSKDDVVNAVMTVPGQPRPSAFDDKIFGYAGNDKLSGLAGDDHIDGGLGRDLLIGGQGADVLMGGKGQDTVSYSGAAEGVGLSFSDVDGSGLDGYFANATSGGLLGDAKGDSYTSIEVVIGSKFSDAIGGGTQEMQFFLGAGDDIFDTNYYLDVTDKVHGQSGADRIWGGKGNDSLFGDAGQDQIFGEDGNDTIVGGNGRDFLSGGVGADNFVLSNRTSSQDVIGDFETGIDSLQISAKLFRGGLVSGTALTADQFEVNDSGVATDGAVRFVFNSRNHELYFDPDGAGPQARQLVAIFDISSPVLSVNDFVII